MANAGPTSSRRSPNESDGSTGEGSVAGIAPKRLPIVSTGRARSWAPAVAARSATSGAGTRWLTRGQSPRIARVNSVMPTAYGLKVPACRRYEPIRSTSSAGGSVMRRPSASRSCWTAMRAPIAAVKPVMTGNGMNLMAPPSRASPRATRMTPAIMVAASSPSRPYCCTIPYTITTNAPVGPPIWTREPPSAEMRKPAITAV